MIRKIWIVLAVAVLLAGCKPKEPEAPKMDVTGIWELVSVTTKVSVAGEQVSVYLDLAADGSFTLFQKIGLGRYTRFSGSWSLDQDAKQLSGNYSDASAWGPYDCTCADDKLTLSFVDGSETDTYSRIDAIPDEVTQNVY